MALLKAQIDQGFDQINVPDEDGYLRVPYDFCKATKRISDCLVRAMIYSFSCVKGRPDARCAMSYSRIQDKLHYSRSTVNAAIHAATENGAFDQDKSNRFRASYKYLQTATDEESGEASASALPSFTVEFYLLHTAFVGKDNKFHYLPKSAALVLGLIKTHYENGGFVGSVRGIALTLGLSPTTVQKAINLLMDLSLIFRPKERRGVNRSRRSAYAVNEKLLRKAERNFKKQLKSKDRSSADDPEDVKIERERYYARLQQAERERVESFERTLNADSRYFALDRRRRQLEIEVAKAEVFMPIRLPELEEELRQVNVDRARQMAQIGISEEDLKPRFLCPKCEDTGYNKSDGRMCDCFPKRRRT